jgi:hypothetical protein
MYASIVNSVLERDHTCNGLSDGQFDQQGNKRMRRESKAQLVPLIEKLIIAGARSDNLNFTQLQECGQLRLFKILYKLGHRFKDVEMPVEIDEWLDEWDEVRTLQELAARVFVRNASRRERIASIRGLRKRSIVRQYLTLSHIESESYHFNVDRVLAEFEFIFESESEYRIFVSDAYAEQGLNIETFFKSRCDRHASNAGIDAEQFWLSMNDSYEPSNLNSENYEEHIAGRSAEFSRLIKERLENRAKDELLYAKLEFLMHKCLDI